MRRSRGHWGTLDNVIGGPCVRHVTQDDCYYIAFKLNSRPRERFAFKTPAELFYPS